MFFFSGKLFIWLLQSGSTQTEQGPLLASLDAKPTEDLQGKLSRTNLGHIQKIDLSETYMKIKPQSQVWKHLFVVFFFSPLKNGLHMVIRKTPTSMVASHHTHHHRTRYFYTVYYRPTSPTLTKKYNPMTPLQPYDSS